MSTIVLNLFARQGTRRTDEQKATRYFLLWEA